MAMYLADDMTEQELLDAAEERRQVALVEACVRELHESPVNGAPVMSIGYARGVLVTRDVASTDPHNHSGRDVAKGEVLYEYHGATWGSVDGEHGIALCERPGGAFFEFPLDAVKMPSAEVPSSYVSGAEPYPIAAFQWSEGIARIDQDPRVSDICIDMEEGPGDDLSFAR